MSKIFQQSETTQAWAKQAGLDFKIARSRVRFGEGPEQRTWDSQHVLFRSDTRAPLGVVSDGYKVVQPIQALDFFRHLVDDGSYEIVNAGAFGGGARYWAQAKRVGLDGDVIKGDKVTPFLFFSSSCDGSSSTVADFTTVRIYCENTLRMALSRKLASESRVSITHRTEVDAAVLADARERLGLADKQFTTWLEGARELAKIKVGDTGAGLQVVKLLSGVDSLLDLSPNEQDKVRESRAYKSILRLFDGEGKAADLEGVRGTAWGLLNAVTEHVDHHTRSKTMESAWTGEGANLKTRAFEQLLQY